MDEFLAKLSTHSDVLTLIFTAVVTLSTAVYAVLTGILVSETRKMREVQTEPKFHITVDSYDFAIHIMRLNFQNIGMGVAKNLKIYPSIVSGGESADLLLSDFTKSNFFKTGLRHFGPNQIIYSTYTDTSKDYEGKSLSILSFKLEYESISGKKYFEEIVIDMSEIKGRYQLGKPNLYAIAKSVENIQKDFGHVVSGFKKMNINVYTSEDRRKEEEEREEWYKEQINSEESA